MNQFIQRVVNWLANEIIVKQLSQNKSFQNLALRTHLHVEKTKESAKAAFEEAASKAQKEAVKQQGQLGNE
jgi:hypothetical protein